VLFDWNVVTRPYQHPDIGFVDVLVQRAKTAAIKTVMIAGEVVYADGRFTRLDRDGILAEIGARLARPLTAAEAVRRDLARAVFPHVQMFYDGYLDPWRPEPFERWNSRS
jgi:5-methylthioadenosine/S-adenosylhomocysteine deaminase